MRGKVDLSGGASLRMDLGKTFGIRVGAHYARRGLAADANLFGTPLDFSLNFAYLELPVQAVLTLPVGESRGRRPFFAVGPVIGIELACTVVLSVDGQSEDFTCAEDEDDAGLETASVDFGVAFGGGLNIPARGFLLSTGVIIPIGGSRQ